MTDRFKKAVALDFDGVLHTYTSPWTCPHEIHDGPVPGALEAVRSYLDADYDIHVFSARAADTRGQIAIFQWLEAHGFPHDRMTVGCTKPHAEIYIDDRGYLFTGTFPTVEEVRQFRPWNKQQRVLPVTLMSWGPRAEDKIITPSCDCGHPSPCSFHETTPKMREALQALLELDPVQRGRLLCWFCSECYEQIPPGGEHKCGMEVEILSEERYVKLHPPRRT